MFRASYLMIDGRLYNLMYLIVYTEVICTLRPLSYNMPTYSNLLKCVQTLISKTYSPVITTTTQTLYLRKWSSKDREQANINFLTYMHG